MKQAIVQCGDNLTNGKVVNIIEITAEAALSFILGENQIMWNCDNIPTAIGDDWNDGVFSRNGERVVVVASQVDILQQEVTNLQLALTESFEENSMLKSELIDTQLAICEIYEIIGGN